MGKPPAGLGPEQEGDTLWWGLGQAAFWRWFIHSANTVAVDLVPSLRVGASRTNVQLVWEERSKKQEEGEEIPSQSS